MQPYWFSGAHFWRTSLPLL